MLKPKLAPPRPAILADALDKPEVLKGDDANGFDQDAKKQRKGAAKGASKGAKNWSGTKSKSFDSNAANETHGTSWSSGSKQWSKQDSGKQWDKQADWQGKRQVDWKSDSQTDWKKSKSWQESSFNGTKGSKGKGKGKGKGKSKNTGGAPKELPVDDKPVALGPKGRWQVDSQWASATVRAGMTNEVKRLGTKPGGSIITGFDQGDWIKLEGEEGFISKVDHGQLILIHLEGGLGKDPVAMQVAGKSLCGADDLEAVRPAAAAMQSGSTMPSTPQALKPALPVQPLQAMPQAQVGWKRLESRSSPGVYYYYNDQSGESQPDPPPPWEKKESRSQAGAFYYYNSTTGVSCGEKPQV